MRFWLYHIYIFSHYLIKAGFSVHAIECKKLVSISIKLLSVTSLTLTQTEQYYYYTCTVVFMYSAVHFIHVRFQ